MILLALAVFAGLSLNLILQFALGLNRVEKEYELPFSQIIGLFVTVLLLWIIHTYILNFFSWEFIGFFLIFPLSALSCLGFEIIEKRFFPNIIGKTRLFSALSAYEGLVPASLLLTLNLAVNFLDAFVLSFFFALGCLMAIFILMEIKRCSTLEEIPSWFRGMPLVLISSGLLSMVFASVAWICFRILDNF